MLLREQVIAVEKLRERERWRIWWINGSNRDVSFSGCHLLSRKENVTVRKREVFLLKRRLPWRMNRFFGCPGFHFGSGRLVGNLTLRDRDIYSRSVINM